MQKTKISITLDSGLSEELKALAQAQGISASRLIEQALFDWKKELIKRQLIEGYQAMAQENREIAQDFHAAGDDIWPDA